MSAGVRGSNSAYIPTDNTDNGRSNSRRNCIKLALFTGGILVVIIIVTVLIVVLTGNTSDDKTTLTPIDNTTPGDETTIETTTSLVDTDTESQTDTATSGDDTTIETTTSLLDTDSESQTDTAASTPLPLEEITLDDILHGTLSPKPFSNRWVTGKDVLVIDADGLKLFDVLTETYNLLLAKVDGDLLSKAFKYSISPKNTHLIIGYDQVNDYRNRYEASYSVVELNNDGAGTAGQEIKIFINDPTDKLTLVQWSPTGQSLLIIFKNNINYKSDLTAKPSQITRDGNNTTFNGIPDWVYEEQVFGSNSVLQFSPDGTKLAFIRFNVINVEIFEYTYYGEPGNIEAQYPINMQVSYPKVGTANPTVSVFVYNIDLPISELFPVPRFEIPVPIELSNEDHIITTLSWANNENIIVTWMNRVQNNAYIQVCNPPTCSVIGHLASTDGWVELFSNPLYNADGSQFALIISQNQGGDAGGYRHLTLFSIVDGSQIVLTKGKYVVTQLLHWDIELNYIFYSANTEVDSRVSQIYAIKAEQDAQARCLTCDLGALWDEYKYFSASFSKDEKLIGLNALGPAVPRADIFSYSEVENTIHLVHERVWEINEELHDKLINLNIPTVEYDDEIILSSGYKAQASMILPGDIDRSGTTKYPVLINVYGEPDANSVTFQWETNWGTYMAASKSIIYVKIDGRGAGLRGDKLLNEIYRKLGTVEIQDQIESAKALTEKYPFIDRDRIAIWGWGYGGYVAGLALVKNTEDIFKCAASVAPITDWIYYDTIYTERYMGRLIDNLAGYETSRLSTLYQEFEGKNYFLIHGTLDNNVHYQQAMALSRSLEKHAVLFKQMSYPDEDHSLSGVQQHLYITLEHYFNDCFT